MKQGARYKTKRERQNALAFSSPRMRGFKEELNRKMADRSATRPVRESAFFKLVYNKVEGQYLLEDLKNGGCFGLSKAEIEDCEIAIGTTKDFNQIAASLFNTHKLR